MLLSISGVWVLEFELTYYINLQEEIFDILNSLMTPLLGRIFASLGEETTGTDDALELADLRKEYISFLLCVLNNDLGNVLVSEGGSHSSQTITHSVADNL